MAVGMLLAGPGVSEDSYRQLTKKMFGSFPMTQEQSPEGLIVHTAGDSDQGWYVYDVWESKEHFNRFLETKLGPAAQELGADAESAPVPQFFEIQTLVWGRST